MTTQESSTLGYTNRPHGKCCEIYIDSNQNSTALNIHGCLVFPLKFLRSNSWNIQTIHAIPNFIYRGKCLFVFRNSISCMAVVISNLIQYSLWLPQLPLIHYLQKVLKYLSNRQQLPNSLMRLELQKMIHDSWLLIFDLINPSIQQFHYRYLQIEKVQFQHLLGYL